MKQHDLALKAVPWLQVGILSAPQVRFCFCGAYTWEGTQYEGDQEAVCSDGQITFAGRRYASLTFQPVDEQATFVIEEVTIGVQFHWQRKEQQRFAGRLRLVVDPASKGSQLVVINEIDVERYLTSVISSEMSATASKALLKAHAVISRSWVLAQIGPSTSRSEQGPHDPLSDTSSSGKQSSSSDAMQESENLRIRWYDHDDHTLFDVCADDHCQRYQGVTRASTPIVEEAVHETAGEVLLYAGTLCDTRFSKCCGGVTEQFESCWEPVPHPYLRAVRDGAETAFPDLTQEKEADRWIRQAPPAYCHTRDAAILRQVLNSYDQETTDFYRWQVQYTQEELSELIARKSGFHVGQVVDLVPIERGPSGRIVRLEIRGTARSVVIGKELEIRRTLSETHLYSSAFVVEKEAVCHGIPASFRLIGAGWGHGVGLCQIGAAVMGAQGFDYRQILMHYYPGATLQRYDEP